MNIAILGVIIIIINRLDCSIIKKDNVFQSEAERGIFLKKLQSSILSGPEEGVQSLTWSEILADVWVNTMKIFLFQTSNVVNETQQVKTYQTENISFITKFCGKVLDVYKRYVYDNIFSSKFEDVTVKTTSEISTYNIDIQLNEAERAKDPKEDFEIITINPDFEIIGTEYHGKLCEDCKEDTNVQDDYKTVKEDCPVGLKRDAKGNCVDPKPSNFILSVPYQCPIGYRADWFGYCRMIF
ncbi:unnamed protein product [Parnassius apollo]|uniref:(apollo) hypothetical protein n=1 Tax=Parnassius apollo TaxID=110799 RepID=A0A8S3WVX8_PARAO|nr:unnamed protein product [Parnassius apollo]